MEKWTYVFDPIHVVDITTLVILSPSASLHAGQEASVDVSFVLRIIALEELGHATARGGAAATPSCALTAVSSSHLLLSSAPLPDRHLAELFFIVDIGIRVPI
jgi:hypothetical protein